MNNNLYNLFAYKPASSWHGSWGAYEDYSSHHIFERHLSFEQLKAKLNELYRIEAQLAAAEEGFTDVIVQCCFNPLAGCAYTSANQYRELSTAELHEITEPIRLQAIKDVEAEKLKEQAEEAARTAAETHRAKLAHYESLKKELGL